MDFEKKKHVKLFHWDKHEWKLSCFMTTVIYRFFLLSWWFPATRHIAPRFQHSTQQTSNFLASYLKKFFFYFIRKIRKNLLFLFLIVSLIFSGFRATAVSVYKTVAFFIFGFFLSNQNSKSHLMLLWSVCVFFRTWVAPQFVCKTIEKL